MNEYDKQASDFLESTKTTIELTLNRIGTHWDDEPSQVCNGVSRSVWNVTIKRGGASLSFEFGDSVQQLRDDIEKLRKLRDRRPFGMSMGTPIRYVNLKNGGARPRTIGDESTVHNCINMMRSNPKLVTKPSAYSVLCCLTKYNPGSFENFCAEYGYDTDSRKAEKTYRTVVDEWLKLSAMYSEDELNTLREIN